MATTPRKAVPTPKQPNRRTTPRAVPVDAQPTSAGEWKKASVEGTVYTVPSGKTIRLKTPGMDVFITNGTIPNSLLPMIQESMARGSAPSDEQLKETFADTARLEELMKLASDVTVQCAIEPRIYAVPQNPDDRKDDLLYVDEVDFNDKMYIFNVAVGGPADVEAFRP